MRKHARSFLYNLYNIQKTNCLKQSLWKGTQRGSFPNRLRIWKQIHLISITMLNLKAGQSVLKSHEVIDSAYSDLLQWSLLYLKLHSFTAAFKFSQAMNRTDKSCAINAMILFKSSIELINYFPSNVTNSELKSHTSNHIRITSLFPQPWTKLRHGMSKPRNRSRLFFSLVKAISRVRFFKFSCQGWKLQRVPTWQGKKMPNFAEARCVSLLN